MAIQTSNHKNTMRFSALVATLMLAMSCGNAFAAPPNVTDELTVSGRFELPKAKPNMHQALSVASNIEADEETRKSIANIMKMNPEELDETLLKAFEKSLANYGYVKPNLTSQNDEESQTLDVQVNTKPAVTIKINSVEFEETDDGVLSVVSLSMDGPKACLQADTEANFVALKRDGGQKGRKVFAFLGAIAIGAVSGDISNSAGFGAIDSSFFLGQQLDEAVLLSKVHTYGKQTAIGESYPPKSGKRTAKRHAMKNAMRLNFARYINLIDQACAE